MRNRAPVSILALALLAGCNFAPRYAQPVAPIPSAFPVSTPPMVEEGALLGWRRYFGDPRLAHHIASALAYNRELQKSVARVAQARARFNIGEAERLPEVSLEESSRDGLLNNFQGPHILTVQTSSFEIDFWSRVRNLAEAQRHEYLAEVEADRAFRISLIGQVAATYFQLVESQERIALAESALALRTDAEQLAKRQLAAGTGTSGAQAQASILVAQAQVELADLRRKQGQVQNFLDLLVGGTDRGGYPAGLSLYDERQVAPVDPGLPSALLANRPDVRREEEHLRAANANIGAARAAFLPSISLSAAGGFLSSSLRTLIDRDNAGYQLTGGAILPIFDAGQRRGQLRLVQAQAREYVAAYQLTAQQAFREVADALTGREQLARQIEAQRHMVDARRALLRVAQGQLASGLVSQLDVLEARRELFIEEQREVGLRSTQLQNGVSLYVALGGGPRDF